MQSKEFGAEEVKAILGQAHRLAQRGYFTGMNLVLADRPLPSSSIVVHFLQDSKEHIEQVRQVSGIEGMVVPRYSVYRMDQKYFEKEGFREEYKRAVFYDKDFNQLNIEDAIRQKVDITVANPELDLLAPLSAQGLEQTVVALRRADELGIAPWIDPVIIIRSEQSLPPLEGFVPDLHFAAITGVNEEFYAVVADKNRLKALKNYLRMTCSQGKCPGKLSENAIVFSPSQVNEEFFAYMVKNLKPLEE